VKRLTAVLVIVLASICFAGIEFAPKPIEDSKPLTEFQIRNLATFCKVWGFLKYYHPFPSEKKVDWDKVLIDNYSQVKDATTKAEFDKIIDSLISSCGKVKTRKNKFFPTPAQSLNADFKWLSDTAGFSAASSDYMNSVFTNHRRFKSKYVQIDNLFVGNPRFNETAYEEMVYPNEAYRYLALARYWNAVNYYFPSKYLMDHPWDESLKEALPVFQTAKDSAEYYRAIQWITARIDDGHAMYVRSPWKEVFMVPPFGTFFSNEQLTVTAFANDSLAKLSELQIGDVILKINERPVKTVWNDVLTHHSVSNLPFAEFTFGRSSYMLKSTLDTSIMVIRRNNSELTVRVKNYEPLPLYKLWRTPEFKRKRVTGVYTDSISGITYGYFNMGTLLKDDVDQLYTKMQQYPSLVLDARNYPKEFMAWVALANRIVTPKQNIALMSVPDYEHPGYFKYNKVGLQVGCDAYQCYKGNVFILVDHTTMSQAEYQVMALRLAPHATVIGTQTAGADGNISTVVFPGNYSCNFSGLGWYYADGRQTQRIGIVPDIKVDYTVETELAQRDPIMEKALELIRISK
jgi:carboxyl-terminal processing protease